MGRDPSSDEHLVKLVLGGEQKRFRELVERHQARVYSLVQRLIEDPTDAEDLTQQTFVEAYQALPSFDRRRRFSTWLRRIATNNCMDHLKSHRRLESPDAEIEGCETALFSGRVAPPDQALRDSRRSRELLSALGRLAPEYRIPLVLKDLEGLSYNEIRQITDLPLTTLKIRVIRARVKLREALQWTTRKS